MKTFIKQLAAIALLCTTSTVIAATASQEFASGVHAYSSGNLQTARKHFEAAKKAGLATPALYYNLGVTYYRLGQYDLAREAFTALLPDHGAEALAAYNLGLIAAKQGDDQVARRWMERARDRARDARLKGLAIQALNTLGANGKTAATEKKWSSLITMGLGYDDEVSTLTATGKPTGKGDSYGELFAATNGTLSGRVNHGLQLGLSAYALRLSQISNYDLSLGRASLKWRQPFSGWRTETALFVDTSRLGATAYLDTTGVTLTGSSDLAPDMSTRLRFRSENIKAGDAAYDYLTGSRQRLWAELRRRASTSDWRVELALETNNRKNTATASFSPTRAGLKLTITPHLSDRTDLQLGAALRSSVYSTVAATTRKDTRSRFELGFRHHLNADWNLNGRYTYTDNNSNTTGYSYSRNLYSLSVSRFF